MQKKNNLFIYISENLIRNPYCFKLDFLVSQWLLLLLLLFSASYAKKIEVFILTYYLVLAHLTWKLNWAFLNACCPSVNFAHFYLQCHKIHHDLHNEENFFFKEGATTFLNSDYTASRFSKLNHRNSVDVIFFFCCAKMVKNYKVQI